MSQQKPIIREMYKNYAPPINLPEVIQILMEPVPKEYLIGLKEIVLTNVSALSRHRRRQKTASGLSIDSVCGLYHQGFNGQAAWIEVFVDKTLERIPKPLVKLLFFRTFVFSEVLYHEIGHHIQLINNPSIGQSEKLADKYDVRLFRLFLQSRYGYIQTLIYPLRLVFKVLDWRTGKRYFSSR